MTTQDPQEEKLLDELETMYRQVAKSEKPVDNGESEETLQSYYNVLQVNSDAPLQAVKESYEQLVDFWKAGQVGVSDSFREKAEKKLGEINHAYEKILAFRQRERVARSEEPTGKTHEEAALSAPAEETAPHFPWGTILLGGAVVIAVVLAAFFWPIFYRYDAVQIGDPTNQVKTKPIRDGKTSPPPVLDPPSPAKTPAPSLKQPISAPVAKPAPEAEATVTHKKEAPSEKEAIHPGQLHGYAIQISAMRDLNIAKEYADMQKKHGQEVYWIISKAKDGSVWYKIYLGRFSDKAEAARYLKEKKIKEIFPGCFIQKLS
jgi:cell division septation protein DedD